MIAQEYKTPTIDEIRQARKRAIVVNMYTVFGDESHDPKQERVFAVAGVLGTQEEWDDLEVKWRECLDGKVFHAADCQSGYGEFKNIPHEERERLYRHLVSLLANSFLSGYGAVMDLAAYRTIFPDAIDYVAYIHCFNKVIEFFAEKVHVLIPQGKVKFVFDNNDKIHYTATALFEIYSTNPRWKYHEELLHPGIQYAWKKDFIGLQATDLYAREVMKDGDNYFKYLRGECGRVQRESLKRLREAHRYTIHYFKKEYWEDYKNKMPEIDERDGLSPDDYINWLKEKSLVDNLPNRTHFFKYINQDKSEEGKEKISESSEDI